MKDDSRLANLHLKFAGKPWGDTLQLVRRCMEKSRDKSKPCEQMVRVLDKLKGELSASSMNVTKTHLEVIARQQGMGFHVTESAHYLTSDLFYIEVFFQPCGRAGEVKVATHGKSPSPSESLLQLLRSDNFADFSKVLGRLFAQYNIPGNETVKLKLLASLQYLMKDLQQLSNVPRNPKYSDSQVEMINNGLVGLLSENKDYPITIKYYKSPNDGSKTVNSTQAAQVTVASCETTHKLQMASVFLKPPQLDLLGCPPGMDDVPCEMLAACFLLKLLPELPIMSFIVKKLSDVTEVLIPDADLQWAPLPKILLGSQHGSSSWDSLDGNETTYTVPLLGGERHTYVFPDSLWNGPDHRGAMMDSIPFTNPTQVPAILDLLRQQCLLNTVLQSCFASPYPSVESSYWNLHFEVLPESESSFSVTFHHPTMDSLCVLMVNICNPHEITCSLFGLETVDASIDEYISTQLQSSLSLPWTMKKLWSKLESIPSAHSGHPISTKAEKDHLAPSSTVMTDKSRGPVCATVPTVGFTTL